MSISGFIIKNALRNKRRMLLTVLSVAMSSFLLVTLLVALRELTEPPVGAGASLRIAVPNKVSLANHLPERQRPIIERIPGVKAVTPLTWFGGKLNGEESFNLPQFGIDPTLFTTVFNEAVIPGDQVEAWIASRKACIVGKDVAERYRIKLGDRLTLVGDIYPTDLALDVVGIYTITGVAAADSIFFHQKYLDESLGNPGEVGMWWVLAGNAEAVPRIIDAINAAFANTSSEVRAETERAFQMGFISMLANLRVLIGGICAVVVFTLALVTASTMSMAIRERFRELSILKAIGFRRHELFGFILAESFGLSIAGATIGGGLAAGIYSTQIVAVATKGFFPVFQVTPGILASVFFLAAILGIVASVAPSVGVARLSVVGGLRSLD